MTVQETILTYLQEHGWQKHETNTGYYHPNQPKTFIFLHEDHFLTSQYQDFMNRIKNGPHTDTYQNLLHAQQTHPKTHYADPQLLDTIDQQ